MHSFAPLLEKKSYFKLLRKIAEARKIKIYLVGGFVRDLLMGRNSKDIDIVCLGDSIAFSRIFAKRVRVTPPVVFKNFGTAMVRFQGIEFEFVMARKESYVRGSRKPFVSEGSLEDDQLRRDFTINALAISLNKYDFGTLIDPFEGRKDIEKKIIRTPLSPNQTFSDDPLRMLRAIRFSSQLGFRIVEEAKKSIIEEQKRFLILSKQRIINEINKILLSPDPSKGFYLLDELGLLDFILPELQKLKGVEVRGKHSHKDNFIHTLKVLRNISKVTKNIWLLWSALLHDIAKPKTKGFDPLVGFTFHGHEEIGARMIPIIFRRLNLPLRKNMKYVQCLVRYHLRPMALVNENVTDSAIRRLIFDLGDSLDDLFLLCRADITSKNDQKVTLYLRNFDYVEKRIAKVREKDRIRNLQPAIDGNKIMSIFKISQGPQVGKLKKILKDAVLNGVIPNEYDATYNFLIKEAFLLGLLPK